MKRVTRIMLPLALLFSLASSNVASAASHITFGLAPANAAGRIDRSEFAFAATPGAIVHDDVALLNYSDVPIVLHMSAVDAQETPQGGFGLASSASNSTGVGKWTTLPAGFRKVVVAPASSAGPGERTVPFTMHIPDNATPGDHAGGVVAALYTKTKNSKGDVIVVEERIGARVFVAVSGDFRAGVSIEDFHASAPSSLGPWHHTSISISYNVVNTGNVDLRLQQSLGLGGLLVSHRNVAVKALSLLRPGGVVNEHAVVSNVSAPLLANVSVRAVGVQTPTVGEQRSAVASASATLWTGSTTLILIVIVLAALLIFFLWRRRGRRDSTEEA